MKFSIITPSYGQLNWLRLCIASVRDQVTAPNAKTLADQRSRNTSWCGKQVVPACHSRSPEFSVEHIVQDGGTPGIEEFAREAEAEFHQDGKLLPSLSPATHRSSQDKSYALKIFSESDTGMYDAINRGLRRSTGEVCAWLNCDEQYLVGALARTAEAFAALPDAEMLFGNVVVTDPKGGYLCSRSALLPGRIHTLVSGNLSFLSAATFFRRSLVERGLLIPLGWRVAGDAAWTVELLHAGIPMHTLGEYLSAFSDTGDNLSVRPIADRERSRLAARAPRWARILRIIVVGYYRLRKLINGAYHLRYFSYDIYTFTSPSHRQHFEVARPTQRWPGR